MSALRLALAVMLLAAQAGILAVGLFRPNVSDTYRAVFIDKTLDDWPETPYGQPASQQ